jgi:hypothetical protein
VSCPAEPPSRSTVGRSVRVQNEECQTESKSGVRAHKNVLFVGGNYYLTNQPHRNLWRLVSGMIAVFDGIII